MRTRVLLLTFLFGCAATGPSARPERQTADPLGNATATQLFTTGRQLAALGDQIRAEQYLAAAIERGYPAKAALPLLLRVCIAGSRLASALQYASPQLQRHPQDHELRYLVAAVHAGLHHHREAYEELMRVVQALPEFAPAHYLLAVLLRDDLHDPRGAREHFAIHQRLDPRGPHAAEVAQWLREYDHSQRALAKRGGRKPSAALP